MDTPMKAESVTITGFGGDEIEAYFATPTTPGPHPGVVVIHHMPGYDRSTKEIVRTFATYGYAALCPNLHYRYAPGAKATDAAGGRDRSGWSSRRPVHRRRAGCRRLVARRRSPDEAESNGRVGVIGYCSGGRQAYVVACSVDFDAAVDCYGGRVVATPGRSHARPPDLARRPDARPALPAARIVRRRRRQSVTRADGGDRGSVARERQDLRVPHLRERRPCVLLRRSPQLPPRRGARRVEVDLGLLRPLPAVADRTERARAITCGGRRGSPR